MSDPAPVYTDGSEVVTDESAIEPTHAQVMDNVREMVARGALLKTGQVQLADMDEELQNFHRGSVRLIANGSPQDSETWATFEDDPDDDALLLARQYRSNWGSFSVQFFRDGAIDRANRTRLWLRSELGAIYGDSRGYRVARISAVRNLTGLELHEMGQFRKRSEERAAFEVWVNWEERILAKVQRIEGFTVEGNGGWLSDGHRRVQLTLNVDRPAPPTP